MNLIERSQNIWEFIRKSPAQIPSRVAIPDDHVHNEGERLGIAFQPDEHYFVVRINEMYLPYSRLWFNKYDPMVFVVSEFTYDKKEEAVPFVVGPMMMEKFGKKIPAGMVFSDTRVAGLHPYRGGPLTLSVVLCRVQRENHARKLLQVVESAASVLDFSTALSTYVKVAGVVLDGVEALLGLGDTDPLIGLRKEFDPDAGDLLKPSYLALINIPEPELDVNELWVRERQLFHGKSLTDAKPFRDADYVLYSITQIPERSDLTTLPFYPAYERVIKEAMKSITDDRWRATKAEMMVLYETIKFSPDLTPTQAAKLREKYKNEIKQEHDKAVDESTLGPAEEVDSELKEAVSILDL